MAEAVIDPYDLSDEELEIAFREAKTALAVDAANADTSITTDVDTTVDENENNTENVDIDTTAVDVDTEQPENTLDSTDNVKQDDTTIEVDGTQPEQTENVDKVEPKVEQVAVKHKFKANGQEFEFTEDEIKDQFGKVFAKAMDYTKKTQALAPYKGMIATIKEQNLSQEDLNLAIDVLKGDKKALASIIKRTGVNTLELDDEQIENYRPNNYSWTPDAIKLQEVVDEISRDPEYPITYHVVEKQWDETSRDEFKKQPELIKALHIDIKSGMYDKVSPLATKMKVLDGGRLSDIDYYIRAGQDYNRSLKVEQELEAVRLEAANKLQLEQAAEQERIAKAKIDQAKRLSAQSSVDQKKAAALPTSKAGKKDVIDLLDESDEAYDKWYKDKIENR